MTSFRQSLTDQIWKIPEGRIFQIKDLTFDASRSAYVSNILSELVKKNRRALMLGLTAHWPI